MYRTLVGFLVDVVFQQTIFELKKELNLVYYVQVISRFFDVNEEKWLGRFVRKTLNVVYVGHVVLKGRQRCSFHVQ